LVPSRSNSSFQFRDPQVFGFHPVERRNLSAEHVVPSSKRAGLFDAENIDGPLHQANERSISPGVSTKIAGRLLGERTAAFAKPNPLPGVQDDFSQVLDRIGIGLNLSIRNPFG
jgi:hypothetical protein